MSRVIWIVDNAKDTIALRTGARFNALDWSSIDTSGKMLSEHIGSVSHVVVVSTPDDAGKHFLYGVKNELRETGARCELSVSHLPEGITSLDSWWMRIIAENGGNDSPDGMMSESTYQACQKRFRRELRESCRVVQLESDAKKETPPFTWAATCLSDVDRQPIEWLWPSYLALGKLHCVYGIGGVGKTLVVMQWIAALSTGGDWPDRACGTQPGSAVFLTAEDGVEDTILPRLQAAGGNTDRVFVFDNIYEVGGKRHFFNLSEPDCLNFLEIKLREFKDLKLLAIDPITAFLGGADSHKIGDVRSALFPLSSLAERLGIAVVFIHHFNKATGQNAQHRASGSTAFVDAVRIGIVACENPDNPETRRVVKVVKSNLAEKPPGIGYVIHPAPEFDTARIEWEDEPVEKTDAELMASSSPGSVGKHSQAEAFIMSALSEGERPAKEIFNEGRDAGFTVKEIRTAREGLKVTLKRKGFGKGGSWVWSLPNKDDINDDTVNTIDAIDAHSHDGASMGINETRQEGVQ